MLVVSNTSPISNLAIIGRLDLLRERYGAVLMPPAVKTDLSADLPEGGLVALISTDELLKQTFSALKKGKLEIRPGQANLLALMRRLAPGFMNRQLWKASMELVPVS